MQLDFPTPIIIYPITGHATVDVPMNIFTQVAEGDADDFLDSQEMKHVY